MNNALLTFLTVLTLVIALFNRPLEIMWDNIFRVTKTHNSSIRKVLLFFFKYLNAVILITYLTIWGEFNKLYVLDVGFTVFIICGNVIVDLIKENNLKQRATDLELIGFSYKNIRFVKSVILALGTRTNLDKETSDAFVRRAINIMAHCEKKAKEIKNENRLQPNGTETVKT